MTEALTNQSVIDKVFDHFIRQGKPFGYDAALMSCWYRVGGESDGAPCAIGCLIPDDEYHFCIDPHDDDEDHVDGMSIIDLIKYSKAMSERFGDVDLDLLKLLQSEHDNAAALSVNDDEYKHERFAGEIMNLARRYHLIVPLK